MRPRIGAERPQPSRPAGEGVVTVVNLHSGGGGNDGVADAFREVLPAAEVVQLGPDDDLAEAMKAAAARAVRSTHTSAIGNVSAGHLIFRSAAVAPPSLSARAARGTRRSRDSLMCLPVSVFLRSFSPVIERFSIDEPLIVSAAYELPPSAMNTAKVDIRLA